MLEYTPPEDKGGERHFRAYFIHEKMFIVVSLVKIHFTPGEEKGFYGLMDSVHFEASPPASHDSPKDDQIKNKGTY